MRPGRIVRESRPQAAGFRGAESASMRPGRIVRESIDAYVENLDKMYRFNEARTNRPGKFGAPPRMSANTFSLQ